MPTTAYTGDLVGVTVTGIGTCANGVVVDYDDGNSQEKAGDLPLVFLPKTYSQSGTFTVTASKKPGTLGCNASASTTVKIKKPGEVLIQLCAVVDCGKFLTETTKLTDAAAKTMMKLLPVIEKVFTVPELWTLTPGGDLFLKGKGFGSQAGKVYLRLQSPYQNDLAMPVQSWSATDVKVKVPANITGVLDHNAAVFVETKTGTNSGLQTINFKAARVSKSLKMGDPGVQVVTCSNAADHNSCNNHHSGGGSCFGPGQFFKDSATFSVFHQNCDMIVDWDDGTDTMKLTLQNGWEIAKIDPVSQKSSSSESLNMPSPASLQAWEGSTSWTKSVSWDISPGADHVRYAFFIMIRGPRGTNHF